MTAVHNRCKAVDFIAAVTLLTTAKINGKNCIGLTDKSAFEEYVVYSVGITTVRMWNFAVKEKHALQTL
jgi:hypothetical protein